MTDTIRPIRPDIEPTMDVERELIDWCIEQVRGHVKAHGAPRSIAIALIGQTSTVNSWSPGNEDQLRGECCGYAAALLLKRATGDL